MNANRLAQGLGIFSLGLGLAEMISPALISKSLGLPGKHTLIRGFGAREIAAGAGILASGNPAPWVMSRIGGDALDIASLSAAMKAPNAKRGRIAAVLAGLVAITALDVICAQRLKD